MLLLVVLMKSHLKCNGTLMQPQRILFVRMRSISSNQKVTYYNDALGMGLGK